MNGENTSDNIFHKSLPAVMGGRQFFTETKANYMKSKNRKFLNTPLNPARPPYRKRLTALFFAAWGML